MGSLVRSYWNKEVYGADLSFLTDVIWPLVRSRQMSHDSYTCERFPHARPFPTRRRRDFQHVGQVCDFLPRRALRCHSTAADNHPARAL